MKTKFIYKILNIRYLIILSLLFSFQVNGQTLDAYLQIASKNNPEVKSAYAKFEAALQKSPQVSALPDPTLTVSAFGRMIETRIGRQEARFSLMQMFPWFGTLAAKENAANLMAEALFQNYVDTKNEVFLNVKKVYAEMYELQQMITLEEENLNILNTYKDLALNKFKNGKGVMVDVVRIDIKRNESITNIQILTNKKKPLQIALNTLLNRENTIEILYPTKLPTTNLNVLIASDSLLNNNPKLVQLDRQKEAFEAQKKVAVKESYPKIGIGLDYSIIAKRDVPDLAMNGQDAIMPMLSVTLPIFSKKYKAAQKEAAYMITATEAQKIATTNNLISSYSSSQYEVSKSTDLLKLFENQVKSTKQAMSLLIAAYSNSNADFIEILRLNQDVLMYKKAMATEVKNQFIAAAKLAYLLSKND
ncbi:TolC family protein [Lutibacter maritimus]|uniref:Outer membrane protein TolC n=1 Tax=Lutibacter maritimus TaxID=593133 RepID=A0A1I6Q8G6_9FLAO|nr:TolC family protein [Lutibacter maritimus]SFS48625.1 Outer membrane protein TolC [Lutibacter maritimus]